MQKPAFYRVMVGMPDCIPNALETYRFDSRREMVQSINSILDLYGFTQRNRRQVNLVETWRYIQGGGKRGNFVIRGIWAIRPMPSLFKSQKPSIWRNVKRKPDLTLPGRPDSSF